MGEALREIGRLTVKSYRDAIALLRNMGSALALTLVIMGCASFASILIEGQITTSLGKQLVSTLATIGGIFLASPYFVVLYRFLLLGETNRQPEALRGSDIAMRFFGWSSVLAFLTAAPGYVMAVLSPPGMTLDNADAPENMLAIWLTFLLLILVWIVTTRTITLLPATTMGTVTDLRRSFADTRGRFWFVVGAASAGVLPVMFGGLLLVALTGGFAGIVVSIATSLAVLVIGLTVTANISAWLMDHPK
jgi:hypothetical protein